MPFKFQRLEIPDIILVEARSARDERGYFMETYKQSAFASNGIPELVGAEPVAIRHGGRWSLFGFVICARPLSHSISHVSESCH